MLYLDTETANRGPLTRSTWSDALASPSRQAVLAGVVPALVKEAHPVQPDRLAGIPGLGVPEDVRVDTRRRHETRIWRDYDQEPQALTRERRGLWLLPGVVACRYCRRWEEEKCFDTWKNDFAQAKAWGKGTVAIANQARLAIITRLRVAILLHTRLGAAGAQDEKAWAKQEKRQQAKREDPDGTDRPDWTVPLFRYTAK